MHIVRAAAVLFGLFSATFVHATAQRTFVSTAGVDNPTCSLVAPCRAFGAAITAVAPGGEVIVLDSGGYGPVTITKSVSIIAPTGVYAGISVFSGIGISVDAGASDTVVLRGLTINGQGGDEGIQINGGIVHVENCVIANMTGFGINQAPGLLEVKDTIIRNNGNIGVYVVGPAQANLDHVRIENCPTGLVAYSEAIVAMRESIVTGSSRAGVKVSYIFTANPTNLTISHSLISSSAIGIDVDGANAGGGASVNIADSTVSDNTTYGAYSAGSNSVLAAVRTTFTHNQFGFYVTNIGESVLDACYIGENSGGSFFTGTGTNVYTRDNNTSFSFVSLGTIHHLTAD